MKELALLRQVWPVSLLRVPTKHVPAGEAVEELALMRQVRRVFVGCGGQNRVTSRQLV
jgi:hypothetical protein